MQDPFQGYFDSILTTGFSLHEYHIVLHGLEMVITNMQTRCSLPDVIHHLGNYIANMHKVHSHQQALRHDVVLGHVCCGLSLCKESLCCSYRYGLAYQHILHLYEKIGKESSKVKFQEVNQESSPGSASAS